MTEEEFQEDFSLLVQRNWHMISHLIKLNLLKRLIGILIRRVHMCMRTIDK